MGRCGVGLREKAGVYGDGGGGECVGDYIERREKRARQVCVQVLNMSWRQDTN